MGRTGLMKLDIQKFASGSVSGGNYNSIYSYYLTWSSTSNGSQANTSNVTVNWIYKKNASDPYGAYNTTSSTTVSLTINGNTYSQVAHFDLRSAAVGATQTIASYTVNNIPHNADGSKSINISGSHTTGLNWGTVSIGSTAITLDKIPRYANITSFSVSKRDETSVKFNWSADATCDYAWYSKNNGSSWSSLPSNNIITGLTAGTTYNFKLRVRRADSQLTTDSGTVNQTTYNYPYVSSAPNFVIGDTITIGLYNPLSRTTNIDIKYGNTTITTGSTNTTTYEYDTSLDDTDWYACIPNATSDTYSAVATYSTHTTTAKTGTFSVNTTTSAPSFNLFTWADVNSTTLNLTNNSSTVILGYSNIQATISTANKAEANNEADMSYYLYECGGQSATINYSDSASVSGTINNVTSGTFKVSAVDSRGLTTPVTLNAQNIINYTNLVKGDATINRVGEVSEQVELEFEGDMWVGNFGNTTNNIVNVTYQYKTGDNQPVTGTTVITPTVDQNGHFTFTGYIKGDTDTGFNASNVYIVDVTVYDKLSSVTYTLVIQSGKPHIAYYKDGISIMDKYNEDIGGALQVKGAIRDGVYDNNEKIVGYYFNKPLYQITLRDEYTSSTIYHYIDNVDKIWIDGRHSHFTLSNGETRPICWLAPVTSGGRVDVYCITTQVNSTNISLGVHLPPSTTLSSYDITLFYTKTTD